MSWLKKFFIITTIFYFLVPCHIKANEPEVVFKLNQADAIVLGGNMLLNGLMGGYGAHCSLNPHSKFYRDSNFWEGFKQGLIGGIPLYMGEKMMTFQNEFEYSILIGKQVSDLGTSITYSAALGEMWLKNPRYMTDIGPFVMSWNKQKGLNPELWIMPGSAINSLSAFFRYNLNPEQSLKTGILVFNGELKNTGMYNEEHRPGVHHYNITVLPTDKTKKDNTPAWNYNITLAHEAMHSRQYFMWMPLDPTINYYAGKLPGKLKLLGYEHHPFRFGADVGWIIWEGTGYLSQKAGTPYNYSHSEYLNFNLFNYKDY